jgi:hypothetical protein
MKDVQVRFMNSCFAAFPGEEKPLNRLGRSDTD